MKVKEIAISRKARKGPAHQITSAGAYWLALDVRIDRRGGDGIGQNGAAIVDYYRIRHYRDGSLRAYCESESWHQNYGSATNRVRCDSTLDAETVEDLIAGIKRTPLDREYADVSGRYDVYYPDALAEALPELPAALPSPDEA